MKGLFRLEKGLGGSYTLLVERFYLGMLLLTIQAARAVES